MNELETDALNAVEENFRTIDDNFFELLDKCNEETDPIKRANMKRQIGEAHQEALKNLIETQNRILGESDSLVKNLISVATSALKIIANALSNIQDIKTILNDITAAVKQVASVVAMLA